MKNVTHFLFTTQSGGKMLSTLEIQGRRHLVLHMVYSWLFSLVDYKIVSKSSSDKFVKGINPT